MELWGDDAAIEASSLRKKAEQRQLLSKEHIRETRCCQQYSGIAGNESEQCSDRTIQTCNCQRSRNGVGLFRSLRARSCRLLTDFRVRTTKTGNGTRSRSSSTARRSRRKWPSVDLWTVVLLSDSMPLVLSRDRSGPVSCRDRPQVMAENGGAAPAVPRVQSSWWTGSGRCHQLHRKLHLRDERMQDGTRLSHQTGPSMTCVPQQCCSDEVSNFTAYSSGRKFLYNSIGFM